MSNIFEDNQKEEIRFQDGNIVLYEPTEEERNKLKEFIFKSNSEEDKTVVGINFVREIIRTLVKDGGFIDELSDKEIEEQLNNGNRKLTLLQREIKDLLDEIVEDIRYEEEQTMKQIKTMLNIINSKKSEEEMKNKLDKFFKKNKIKTKYDELIQKGMASEELKQLIENAKAESKTKKSK
jgi:hypothetical protein